MAMPFATPNVTTQSATDAYWQLINHVGNWWWDRDAIDERIVNIARDLDMDTFNIRAVYDIDPVAEWIGTFDPQLAEEFWKGFVDGEDSGVYKATPLSRCNVSEGMATPLAQKEWERMYSTLGGRPVTLLVRRPTCA